MLACDQMHRPLVSISSEAKHIQTRKVKATYKEKEKKKPHTKQARKQTNKITPQGFANQKRLKAISLF